MLLPGKISKGEQHLQKEVSWLKWVPKHTSVMSLKEIQDELKEKRKREAARRKTKSKEEGKQQKQKEKSGKKQQQKECNSGKRHNRNKGMA